jgi:hypothetical protein
MAHSHAEAHWKPHIRCQVPFINMAKTAANYG